MATRRKVKNTDNDGDADDESKLIKEKSQTHKLIKKTEPSAKSVQIKSCQSTFSCLSDPWFWLFISTLTILLGALVYIINTEKSRCCAGQYSEKEVGYPHDHHHEQEFL